MNKAILTLVLDVRTREGAQDREIRPRDDGSLPGRHLS